MTSGGGGELASDHGEAKRGGGEDLCLMVFDGFIDGHCAVAADFDVGIDAEAGRYQAVFVDQRLEATFEFLRDDGEAADALKADDFEAGADPAGCYFCNKFVEAILQAVEFVGEAVERGAEFEGHIRLSPRLRAP